MDKTKKIIKRELVVPGTLCVREAGEGEPQSRTITGYAILFNTPSAPLWEDDEDECREVIAPEAITKEVLDASDIKMTMFHDRQLILARSREGKGTLTYNVDEKGVSFEFEAPNTADGDKALELVRRGDISGCSFAFSTYYWDSGYVTRTQNLGDDGKRHIVCTVRQVRGIHDFTLAADPAYPDTSCSADERELVEELRGISQPEPPKDLEKMREQVREMRRAASQSLR